MNTPHPAENTQQHMPPMPTSPWTEPFQQAQANAATQPADRRDEKAQAQQPAEPDSNYPTHDALSAIFNGH
jgi:hypothetical protein